MRQPYSISFFLFFFPFLFSLFSIVNWFTQFGLLLCFLFCFAMFCLDILLPLLLRFIQIGSILNRMRRHHYKIYAIEEYQMPNDVHLYEIKCHVLCNFIRAERILLGFWFQKCCPIYCFAFDFVTVSHFVFLCFFFLLLHLLFLFLVSKSFAIVSLKRK